ncbi:germination protein, Ger(x)C family [Fontibacillus panacisegetis]|uniref:Germination protein, Ger(X)C family n=1 Tax=Fontibacillus panacisegetis TaxID=670482 RepID=A0A1G7IT63_9BACL|nr:Ger(x)C family spore germination protein [Fontibacillus panacisegetis]SDF15499.1 germination protein, Ger(x)C family [Fontibacillus panacisegetis]
MRNVIVFLIMITMLTGCWDLKEVQTVNFVTALGIDYVKDHYVIYAQLLDFSKISKQEGASSGIEKSDTWIGKAEGGTISEALNHMYPSSQQQTLWTHVKAIVMSKALLDKELPDTLNGLLRSRDLRYTPWVFGTEQDISKLFSSVALLNQSSLNSELMDPEELYKQYSSVEPQRLLKLVNGVKEPAASLLLPSITVTDSVWENDNKPQSLIKLNGVYVISRGKNRGFIDQKQLNGARWVSYKYMHKYPLRFETKEGKKVVINVIHPVSTVKLRIANDNIQANINVRVRANVVDIDAGSRVTAVEIKQIAKQMMEKQIRTDYESAKANNLDIYKLDDFLYRMHNREWQKYRSNEHDALSKINLGEVNIDLRVTHSTSYKLSNS